MVLDNIKQRWLAENFSLPLLYRSGKCIGHANMRIQKIEENNCILNVIYNNGEISSFQAYNCHQCLDKFRTIMDRDDILVGCYGSVRNFYVTKGMSRTSYGLKGFLTEFGSVPITGANLPERETFIEFTDVGELASVSEQRAYRALSMNS